MPNEPQEMLACAVCALPLSRLQVRDSFGVVSSAWVHAGAPINIDAADHPAVPVSREDVSLETRCDFCSTAYPAWILPVEDIDLFVVITPTSEVGHNSIGDWGACDECAELIGEGRWDALSDRSVRLLVGSSPHLRADDQFALRQRIGLLHQAVREHSRGPLRKIHGGIRDDRP